MLKVRFVPILQWPRPFTRERRSGKSFMKSYHKILETLSYEIEAVSGKNVTIQTAHRAEDIRLDGWPRASARQPAHPGVIAVFDSPHGPLSFACDSYDSWTGNMRAIALTLEALRAVTRHGATKHGEQYRGYRALPEPGKEPAAVAPPAVFTDAEGAAGWLFNHTGEDIPEHFSAALLLRDPAAFGVAWRSAAKRLHPDQGGSARDFALLERAREILSAHHDAQQKQKGGM